MRTTSNEAADASRASESAKPASSFGGRWTYAVVALALLFVLMPFLFWNATWFGRPLTNSQITKALADNSHPREIQHALTQIEGRIEGRDPSVKQWYPQLLALSAHPVDEIRLTDAWVMGQDTANADFHQALLKLLADPQVMVERNAALSLVRFGDPAGHAAIVAMLRPYQLPSPAAGTLETRLKPGDVINPGTLVAHIIVNGDTREVRATVPGTLASWRVANGSSVSVGQPLVTLDPAESVVWEGLRALYLIGRTEDLQDVERFTRGAEGMSPRIAQQALATMHAIQSRPSSS
jgi:biotin carboxyl carrier protein